MHRESLLQLPVFSAGLIFALAPNGSASAATLSTLHSFCAQTGCADGMTPLAGLVMDSSGNLYGTAEQGGTYSRGLVFELVPNAQKTKYKEKVLHNFCANANCPDGAFPQTADLILDIDGNLYGTAAGGGKHNGGDVFRLKHGANGWSFTVIHSFCAATGCTDGNLPNAGLAYAGQSAGAPWDESSPLFGATDYGGSNNKGLAYKLAPGGSNWTYKVLHSFNAEADAKSAVPGPILVDPSGNLVGVTSFGGAYQAGVLYRLAASTWTETTLHNFCAETNCTDGADGVGRLTMDAAGDIFGTTTYGGTGAHCLVTGGCGAVFERPPGGPYTVIYSFCSLNGCKDGRYPLAGAIMDPAGSLYGTTDEGGTQDGGTAYSVSHATTWTESVLHKFCSQPNCADGKEPGTPLILGNHGTLFGTTAQDGANGTGGTVFKLTP
jgi:uncharacterized repeat protein (TIGR03803 family)